MDSLDIQVVDSLTVNLNQEDYSTEGLVLNSIEMYIEDGLELFDAALTQDPITLYTEETPEVIMLDTMKLVDSISRVELEIKKTSKEATLLAKVAELKEALNTIDFTAIELKIELKIQNVENVTAREATLIQGITDVIIAIENIDFTDLENSIAEVKNAVANIDFSALAKEETFTQGISSVENKVDEGVETLSNKIDNIDLSAVESKVQEESTAIQRKLDNLNVEVDLTQVAKQGSNADATNSKIYEDTHNVAQFFGITAATDFTPLTTEEITNEINTLWEGL